MQLLCRQYLFNVRSLSQYWICLSVKIKFHFFNQTRYLSQRTFIELVFTIVRRKQWLLHAWWVILRYCDLFLYGLEICAFDSWFLWNSMNIRFQYSQSAATLILDDHLSLCGPEMNISQCHGVCLRYARCEYILYRFYGFNIKP